MHDEAVLLPLMQALQLQRLFCSAIATVPVLPYWPPRNVSRIVPRHCRYGAASFVEEETLAGIRQAAEVGKQPTGRVG